MLVTIISSRQAYSAEHQSKVVFVLFDISDSTKKEEIRKRYLEDFKAVLNKINPGDVIVADRITEASITKSTVPVKEEFEKPSFLEGGPLKDRMLKKKHAERKDKIIDDVEKNILRQNIKVPYTDILSSLHIAEKVFKSYKRDKYVLVIMSDMIEESMDYNFAKDNLTEKRINEIISIEKKKNRIPELANVRVYVTGATAGNRDRFFAVQNFWLRYFKECGANLSKENYGSALLNFNE
jgi:hypothetical protein